MRQGENVVTYGEGQGVVRTKDGKGMATWTGQGIGIFTGAGKLSFRGSLFKVNKLIETYTSGSVSVD